MWALKWIDNQLWEQLRNSDPGAGKTSKLSQYYIFNMYQTLLNDKKINKRWINFCTYTVKEYS